MEAESCLEAMAASSVPDSWLLETSSKLLHMCLTVNLSCTLIIDEDLHIIERADYFCAQAYILFGELTKNLHKPALPCWHQEAVNEFSAGPQLLLGGGHVPGPFAVVFWREFIDIPGRR